ncbi:septation ring formation regulator EzrA [Streptococcus plurextorum]|uniref:septation ring formation regulator EzrA n=1 Tax=Streptococcus plurextorum TaxID=456876 RepID=UPI000405791D|nr:septation ring formation regulator EzrA [Streptococcus plurextorum]
MSNGIVLLVVAIIVLVIIAYLFGVVIRKRNDALIASLEEKKQELFDLPVNEEIEHVKNLHLIGQSQTTFREWNQKWVDLSLNSFSDIENHIFEAENYNDTFNFIRAKQEIKAIQSQLSVIEEDITAIREALVLLAEQEDKNSSRVTYALDMYENLQNEIASQTDSYGPAMPEIRKQLTHIQSEFTQFVTLNSSGDPVEAAEILEKAEEHTIALGQIAEKIQPLVSQLEDNLPGQLEDLETGYSRLLEENYYFSEENIESDFQIIREAISDSTDDLANLELDKVEASCQDIQNRLDTFYDLFEREIADHKEVLKLTQRLPKYLKHVEEMNDNLIVELNRLTHRYIFSDNIGNRLGIYKANLSELEVELQPALEDIADEEKPFSDWKKALKKLESKITDIEEGQLTIFEALKETEKGEVEAQHQLENYINRLHVIKRFMEKRNLPGIPQEFMSYFFTASSQLEVLRDELSRLRVDMVAVGKMLDVATSAMTTLEDATYQVVRDAVLTEQLLQYSNRYRSFDPNVQESYERSMQAFQMDFNYKAAFAEISDALEVVEPGVTSRFVTSYEKSKEIIRF